MQGPPPNRSGIVWYVRLLKFRPLGGGTMAQVYCRRGLDEESEVFSVCSGKIRVYTPLPYLQQDSKNSLPEVASRRYDRGPHSLEQVGHEIAALAQMKRSHPCHQTASEYGSYSPVA